MIRRFHSQSVPRPIGSVFRLPEGPLDLEIGAGVGWHAIEYARSNPGRTLIAIERTKSKFSSFESRLARHPGLTRLHAIHADAVAWVTHFLPEESLDRVFILYPNPEPGRRSQRWAWMPFMEKLHSVMKPGATLTLATNEAGYARESEIMLTRHWGMVQLSSETIAPNAMPRTHFEKKYLARGETCYDLVFRRIIPPCREFDSRHRPRVDSMSGISAPPGSLI